MLVHYVPSLAITTPFPDGLVEHVHVARRPATKPAVRTRTPLRHVHRTGTPDAGVPSARPQSC